MAIRLLDRTRITARPGLAWPRLSSAIAVIPAAARRVPVSLSLALMTLMASVSAVLPAPYDAVAHLGEYRGVDLTHQQVLWRLPLSALLSQSWLQCAWTLLVIATVFFAAERRIGSLTLLVVVLASHVVSTVAVDSAVWFIRPGLLAWYDYGPSCLMMGALAALLWRTWSRWLMAGMVVMFAIDGFINSPMTIAEHVVAVVTGMVVCSCYQIQPRTRGETTTPLGSDSPEVGSRPFGRSARALARDRGAPRLG